MSKSTRYGASDDVHVNIDGPSIPSVVQINQSIIYSNNQSNNHSRNQSRHSSGHSSSNQSSNQSSNHSRSDSGAFDDDFQQLLTPINQRLQLVNACLLVMTRCLKQMKEYSEEQEHARIFNQTINQTNKDKQNQAVLLDSLDEAQHDADQTIKELNVLIERLNEYEISPSWTKTKSKKIRETRNRLVDQTKDVEVRFNQIVHMADKYQTLPRSNSQSNKANKQSSNQSNNQPKKLSPHQSPKQNRPVQKVSSQRTSNHSNDERSSLLQSHKQNNQSNHQPNNQTINHNHQTINPADIQYQQSAFMSRPDVVIDPYMEQDSVERLSLIQSIERDVSVVHDMYNEIHSMVHSQGVSVDTLEDSIQVTMSKTTDAGEQLQQLETSRKRKRRRMLCCAMWGGVLCLILLGVIYILMHMHP